MLLWKQNLHFSQLYWYNGVSTDLTYFLELFASSSTLPYETGRKIKQNQTKKSPTQLYTKLRHHNKDFFNITYGQKEEERTKGVKEQA